MSKFFSQNIKGIEPYVPGEQPRDKKYIKLNTNECPYPPSPRVEDVIKNYSISDFRLYPDPNVTALKQEIADLYGVGVNQVFVGNGSDEVLAMSFMAFFDNDKAIRFPDITYSFYKVYAKIFGVPIKLVKVDEQFRLPIEKFYNSEGGVIFPNPNAPTGIAIELSDIENILSNNKDNVVIVDEAYIDFGGCSAIELLPKYDNLLVVQTFSKSRAMAGARVGYAIGSAELISGLEMVKNSFNSYTIGGVSQKIAVASLKDVEYNNDIKEKIIETREWTKNSLEKLGFSCLPSKANFLFATHESRDAETIFNYLKENGVLVRYFKQDRIDNYLRITIGTDNEMKKLVELLSNI